MRRSVPFRNKANSTWNSSHEGTVPHGSNDSRRNDDARLVPAARHTEANEPRDRLAKLTRGELQAAPFLGNEHPAASRYRFAAILAVLVCLLVAGALWVAIGDAFARLESENEQLKHTISALSEIDPSEEPSTALANEGSLAQSSVHVNVSSIPAGATIWIDGTTAGTAPLSGLSLEPGAYIVAASAPGHRREEQVVTLLGGEQSRTVYFELERSAPAPQQARSTTPAESEQPDAQEEAANAAATPPIDPPPPPPSTTPGRLAITSSPQEASVAIAGKTEGSTPLNLQDLDAGAYRITITKDGFEPWTSVIELTGGETLRVHAELVPGRKQKRIGW